MMNGEKKVVFLQGSVQFPLKLGAMAIIYHGGRITRTSVVAAIHQVSDELIVFETQNSTYCVASKFAPEPAAAMITKLACA